MERRLAAILAADVVGFSRLMELDEAGTLSLLKARRTQVLEPTVAKHRGRVFKITGDGVLIEFASAVNAVECAVELQRAFAAANEGMPADRQIVLRIGVNLGDVMVEGGDLYGEGVNIAARLEALAEPGGVLISGTAHDHVKNKSKLTFADLGSRSLKNIAQPVRVFQVTQQDAPQARKAATTPDKPTIAVLPFTNMSGDPAQQYFSDGMTEDILTALSRFRIISVIARHSSFQYREGKADIRQVGRELGAGYVLEGSVRRAGEIIRITAQLIEVETGNHLWAERYDRPATDLFTVQDEIVSTIAATLFPKLEGAGARLAKRKHPDSLAAHDYLLRGWELQQKSTQADLRPAREMLEKAIAIDPELAAAYTYLALVDQALWDVEGDPALLEQALKNAQRAVELDDEEATGHCILGYVCLLMQQFERAAFHQQRSVTLNPNNANMLAHMGLLKAYLGETQEAVTWLKQAVTINLSPPDWHREYLGFALFCNREYDEAAKNFNSNLGDLPWGRIYAVASYAQLGRTNDAKAQLGLLETRLRGRSLQDYLIGEPFKNPSDLEHLLGALRKAGVAIASPAARGA